MTLADEIRALIRESLCSAIAHRRRLLAGGAAELEEGVVEACGAEGGPMAKAVQEQIQEQSRRGTSESGRFQTAPESGVHAHASPT
jgi:hypothetical protein